MPDDSPRLSEGALAQEVEFLAIKLFAAGAARANDALAPIGLRVRSYSVLSLACGDSQPTQRDLAEFLTLDPSQIVALVNELEERGLVARHVGVHDRRSKLVVGTPHGRELLGRAEVLTKSAEDETLAPLSPSEREQLRRLLFLCVFGG